MKFLTHILLVLILLFSLSLYGRKESNKAEAANPTMALLVTSFVKETYERINVSGLSLEAFEKGVNGYFYLLNREKLDNTNYLTVVDFTKSANRHRLFVFETSTWNLVHTSLVAHGMKTGEEFANDFSNLEHSRKSSVGFFTTGEIYDGRHGNSLKLDGLEYSNNRARERGVVIHSADYVSEDYVVSNGRLGRSYGCPALPHSGYGELVNEIRGGSCFFIYYPEKEYLKKSKILNHSSEIRVDCEGHLVDFQTL